MEPERLVAAREGVPSPAVHLQATTAGDQQPLGVPLRIVEPLDQGLPPRVLVDLVQHHYGTVAWPSQISDDLAVLGSIPVQVDAGLRGLPLEHLASQGSFADLPGARQKDHLALEVLRNGSEQQPIHGDIL